MYFQYKVPARISKDSMEALNEHERHEANNLPREAPVFSAEMVSIRALVDAIGSVVVVNGIDETLEIIETST